MVHVGGIAASGMLAALLLVALPAHAQLGPARAGMMAEADNAGSAATNPAGLMRLAHEQLVVETSIGYTDNEFRVKPATTTTGGDPKNDADVIGLPQLYYARPVGERYRVGLTVNVPTGIGTDYGDEWAGRYMADRTSLFFVQVNPVAAVRINEWLSLGAGASLIYSESESEVAVNNLEPGRADGKMKVELSGYGFGANVSALIELSPETRFGLGYRFESKTSVDGTPRWRNLGPLLDAALQASGVKGEQVDLDMYVPQVVQAGFYHELSPKWSVMGDAVWVDFSEFGNVDISVGQNSTTVDADYDDLWIGSLGTRLRASEVWNLRAGITYISPGVSDSNRTLGLPWDEFWVFGLGVERPLGKTTSLSAQFTWVEGGDSPIDQQSNPLSGRLVGEFSQRRTFLFTMTLFWNRGRS